MAQKLYFNYFLILSRFKILSRFLKRLKNF